MTDLSALQAWIGRRETRQADVPAVLAARMAALLDCDTDTRTGQILPAHWYPMLFGETVPQRQIGADGHPVKGDFLPPVPLPRRMFAGRRVQFLRPLRIGDAVGKSSEVIAITPKTGRSGRMCFVTVRHEISGPEGVAVIEEQDIVYREAPDAASQPAAGRPAPPPERALAPVITLSPDPVMLFRYSAITFNAHRIHYDRDYATGTEHYPGLVVNGGLTLLLLWDYAARLGWRLDASASRNCKPLFAGRAISLHAVSRGAQRWLLARDDSGEIAVEVQVTEVPA